MPIRISTEHNLRIDITMLLHLDKGARERADDVLAFGCVIHI